MTVSGSPPCLEVSVPLPGFSGLRLEINKNHAAIFSIGGVSVPLPGFSGLRLFIASYRRSNVSVSVPLPGFSGLRLLAMQIKWLMICFSPVAGIQWVETIDCFSRVKRKWSFQSRCRDSVG